MMQEYILMILSRKEIKSMSNWMQGLQSILGAVQDNMAQDNAVRQNNATPGNAPANAAGQFGDLGNLGGALGGFLNKDNLSKLLGPAALGGLAGALMGNSKNNGAAQKALLLSGGAALGMFAWDRYKKQIEAALMAKAGQSSPAAAQSFASSSVSQPDERARRLIQAMIFAARSDGNMDDGERLAIEQKVRSLSLGAAAEQGVQEAMQVPVDPETIAKEVDNADEALEVYIVSRSVIHEDQFMERNYLQALAKALNIPEDVQQGIESDIRKVANNAG